jgi:hypothetical protein
MNQWARWRLTYRKGYGTTVLERLLAGMPGTKCPTCQGRGWTIAYPTCPTCVGIGRIKARPMTELVTNRACKTCEVKDEYGNRKSTGEVNGITCLRCKGSGRVVRIFAKINPAFIPTTWNLRIDDDSARIEVAMHELSERPRMQSYYFILLQEYTRLGTPEVKAERMHISHEYYRKLLQRAHDRMAFELGMMRGTLLKFPRKAPCNTVTKPAING